MLLLRRSFRSKRNIFSPLAPLDVFFTMSARIRALDVTLLCSMKTFALESLARALDIWRSQASIPLFLAPAAARPVAWGCPKQRTRQVRKYASIAPTRSLHHKNNLTVGSHQDYSSILSTSPRRRDPKAWADLLDQYLPHELRLGINEFAISVSDADSPRPIQGLPHLLFTARTTKPLKLDLLSYIGVSQGRWEAVVWLVKAILNRCTNSEPLLDWETARCERDTAWVACGKSLEELTSHMILAEEFTKPSGPGPTLDEITHAEPSEHWRVSEYMKREGIGQIWQSIGCMILQAADRPQEDKTFKLIMFNVFQILGHLHHINALPGTIYNYTPAEDPSVLRRPPTLNWLSSHIMTILSDTAWKIHEVSSNPFPIGANRTNSGYELPVASLQPRIRALGPEVWLDLVLWSCVEGGWITQGAWIVGEMMRRKGDQRWSAVNWHALRKPSVQSDAWSRVKSEIERSRMNQIGRGVGIAGRSGGLTIVDTDPRTVSSEVIVALVDGLINTTRSTTGLHGNSPDDVQRYLIACKNLLERKYFALDTNSWNTLILRLVESGGFFPEAEPRILEYIMNLTPSYLKELGALETEMSPSSSVQGYAADQTTANLGLLHRSLRAFSEQGDVQGALRTFKKLQSMVDANRSRAIQDLALDVDYQRLAQVSIESAADDLDAIPGVYPNIPTNVLAAFLDLVTEAKLFDLGTWLLYSDEVDGPTILPEMYSDTNLQPALLRFATATADGSLLNQITKKLVAPLSENVLRALMHCQIVLRKWEAAADLLAYFQEEEEMAWNATDVMVVGRTILRVENNTSIGSLEKTQSLSRARALLQGLLQGKYNSTRDKSQLLDLSQIRMVNQLSRIFQTVPGSLSEIATTVSQSYRASASCSVSSRAFNILLEGIVENHGSIAGRRLWNRWCQRVDSDALKRPLQQSDGTERVVIPNLHILRTIMHPIAQARYSARNKGNLTSKDVRSSGDEQKQSNQISTSAGEKTIANRSTSNARSPPQLSLEEENDLVRWGVRMYRKFGLTDREIDMELPGALSQQEPAEDS